MVDGDIHQAGYYTRSDLDQNVQLLSRSVYSPLFAYRFDSASNSVSYITWPQHAHLPRRYSENQVLLTQTIRDLGEGVVEINVEFDKWEGARYDKISLPWSAFRTGTIPVQIVSNPDGSYSEATQSLRNEKRLAKIEDATTGGWIAFVASNVPSARGIGIVYGKNPRELDGKNGYVRWGNYGPPHRPQLAGTVAQFVEMFGSKLARPRLSILSCPWYPCRHPKEGKPARIQSYTQQTYYSAETGRTIRSMPGYRQGPETWLRKGRNTFILYF